MQGQREGDAGDVLQGQPPPLLREARVEDLGVEDLGVEEIGVENSKLLDEPLCHLYLTVK